MDIVTESRETLALRSRPMLFINASRIFIVALVAIGLQTLYAGELERGLVFIAIGVVVGGAGLLLFARTVDLVFNRKKQSIEHFEKTLWGSTSKTLDLNRLKEADLEYSPRGQPPTPYRVVLTLSQPSGTESYPATKNFFTGRPGKDARDAINAWLRQARR